jgi:hypothetical protein
VERQRCRHLRRDHQYAHGLGTGRLSLSRDRVERRRRHVTDQRTAHRRAAAVCVRVLSPTSGVAGSTVVAITGTNLVGASAVKFNGRVAKVGSDTATQITATVPNGASTGRISVSTRGGIATSAASFTPTLSITSFTPSSGPTGTDVTITGIGFTSTSSVKFNGSRPPS